MKKLRLASIVLAALLLPSITSCTSDPNPFDRDLNEPQEQENALIKLDLSVVGTRADETTPVEDALATDEEKKITKVTVYVFDEKHQLEKTVPNVAVGDGVNSITVEVSHGLKTIYAITAQSVVSPSIGSTHTNFEQTTFVSTLDKLRTDEDGFVMFGKSNEQQVMISASKEEMPASNVFDIKLTRLVAKAQLKATALDGSKFGFSLGAASYRVSQTSDRMMLVHKGTDLITNYTDANKNGTYDGYSIGDTINSAYTNAISGDFTAANCIYMPENIVSSPKSGNTTFLSIRIVTTPTKYYSFGATDQAPKATEETPAAGATYYTVGIIDSEHGVVDYAVDAANNHVLAFKDQTSAQNYVSKLNDGEVSPITVSQTETQLRAPATRAEETAAARFRIFEFKNGLAYYRVNIAHSEKSGDSTVLKNKVVRNKFYQVSINNVNNLGFSSEYMLRPSKADAVLDAVGSSWISASFTVEKWDPVTQEVDL